MEDLQCPLCGLTEADWEVTHKLGCTRCLEIFGAKVERFLIKRGVYSFVFDSDKDLNTIIDQASDSENDDGTHYFQGYLDEEDDSDE